MLYKGWGGGIEFVFILYWFNNDGGDIFWCGIVFEDVMDVGDCFVIIDVV